VSFNNDTRVKFADQIIKCCDCQSNFILTAGEQDFYSRKGLSFPRRCLSCRERRRLAKGGGNDG
jgi:hypothetical protein